MIQMPWTKETFSFFLCKIWNKRQLKNTSLKQFLCPFDNENWRETCQFGYVGGPLSMLTLTWPHKNHWKLFDGSKDLKKYVLKGNSNMYWGISKCHLLKTRFQEQNDLPKNLCSAQILCSCLFSRVGKPFCGQVIFPVHVILPLKVPTGQFCHQLHVIGLSRCMYDTY